MAVPDPETIAKRVIEAHGGIENVIAIAKKRVEEFNSLWLQDAEQIGRVLKAHLTVEFFLTRYIEFKNPMLPGLADARLGFNQKMELLHPNDVLASQLKPGLQRLNQVRNRLVHNLRVEVRRDDVEVFLRVAIFRAMRSESEKRFSETLSDDPVAILEAFAKFVAGLFQAGSTADGQMWADALRESDEKA